MTMDSLDAQRSPFPLVWKALVWILVYFILQMILTIGAVIAVSGADFALLSELGGGMTGASKEAASVVALGGIWGLVLSGAVMLAILLFNLRKDDRKAVIGLNAGSRLSLGQTLGLGIGLLAIAYGLNWLYATYVVPGVELQKDIKMMLAAVPKTPFNMVIIFLAAAVAAPLIEELLFRGYLQTALKQKMGAYAAIGVAALIFALVHMQPLAMPGLFVLGAAFGYLYERTGSLKTNILLHLANNSLALAFM